jgi:hypothetical protein
MCPIRIVILLPGVLKDSDSNYFCFYTIPRPIYNWPNTSLGWFHHIVGKFQNQDDQQEQKQTADESCATFHRNPGSGIGAQHIEEQFGSDH